MEFILTCDHPVDKYVNKKNVNHTLPHQRMRGWDEALPVHREGRWDEEGLSTEDTREKEGTVPRIL